MTPAGTSNELDVQNEWEDNTHTHTRLELALQLTMVGQYYYCYSYNTQYTYWTSSTTVGQYYYYYSYNKNNSYTYWTITSSTTVGQYYYYYSYDSYTYWTSSTTMCMCVCVFFPFILDIMDVPAGVTQERKVTQDFSSTFLVRCVPLFFSREGFSHSFPSSTVKSNFVY